MIIKNALAVNHLSEDMHMARRDNGTGTVYQRPNGSLRAESTREGEQTESPNINASQEKVRRR